MAHKRETRRAVERERASELSLGRDKTEDTQSAPIFNQIAWLQARYPVGEAHARVIAEHAFQRRPQR